MSDRPHTVEFTLVFDSDASAEAVQQGWERLLERLSNVTNAAPALLSLPAIERHDSELSLRWVGVRAPDPLTAQSQVVGFLGQLTMPGLPGPTGLRTTAVAEDG